MLKLYYSFWVHLGGWCCEKAEFLPWSHHPNSSPLNLPAGQLHSLASGAHLNRETCSLVGLGNLLHKGKLSVSCPAGGFAPWGQTSSLLLCSIPEAPSEREGWPESCAQLPGLGGEFLSLKVFVLLFQAKSCICHMCGAHLNRLHSCLYCVFFGCFTKKHIHEHAKTKRHNLGEFSSPCCSSSSVLPCVPGQ